MTPYVLALVAEDYRMSLRAITTGRSLENVKARRMAMFIAWKLGVTQRRIAHAVQLDGSNVCLGIGWIAGHLRQMPTGAVARRTARLMQAARSLPMTSMPRR